MEKERYSIYKSGVTKSWIDVKIREARKLGVAAKEKKRSRVVKKDRLSNLPDEVLHRILSSLDAKSAVQTCVLSKRWTHVWTSLPVLNFCDSSFDDSLYFQCFVDHVLSRRDSSSNVYELNFACTDELEDGHIVDSVVDHVSLTSIQVLSILAECVIGKLPQLSLCQSLTTLKLAHISTETTTFDFVSLENLYLLDCRFECGVEELLDPFRGCVNLKHLYLHRCQYYGGIHRFQIFVPQLTHLSISWMGMNEMFDSDCVVELFTPKLQYFRYHDSDLYDFSIEGNLPFIEQVDIDVGCLTNDTDSLLLLIQLFEMMGSARFVSLSPAIIQALAMIPDLLDGRASPFSRVHTFELNMDRPSSSFVIPPNVMAYLFSGSPAFDFHEWEGSKECKTI
ncbi:hypothetical protein GLYMA_02G294800v4 [Glycine max]|uniref:F-box domain-containing protein n=2 Tax=Glycine subgen. Soja TaxID=1462606 RepID=K7KBI0_SOYBN|nr:F-box/LRR-repeat protein 13 [Glycine max]XP_028221079.1 F-box/LRR-repeat protein 13-like [Glycine soja]KAG5064735.1 hypothetical protein JHK85_005918 [Glycine max]KAH1062738.1 hypothetical protein GYH30_005609 [Glycine max]KHN38243.1 F-box/LRR-repeat protein 13 [Glycine soja]KRH73810.1 hypothetical protein GLYMA_02G294800v4 [Glycine max]RZC27343.1 F-box/LRR-repeat protein 13 [Glycine soja]|eukprot:XP_006575690.1 F-box/LRR-repeat protein 13 [Glycine max]